MERRRFLQLLGIAPVVPYIKFSKKDAEVLQQEAKHEAAVAGIDEGDISHYIVEVREEGGMHGGGMHYKWKTSTPHAHLKLHTPLKKGAKYRVRVRAVDHTGYPGRWTAKTNVSQDKNKLRVEWT